MWGAGVCRVGLYRDKGYPMAIPHVEPGKQLLRIPKSSPGDLDPGDRERRAALPRKDTVYSLWSIARELSREPNMWDPTSGLGDLGISGREVASQHTEEGAGSELPQQGPLSLSGLTPGHSNVPSSRSIFLWAEWLWHRGGLGRLQHVGSKDRKIFHVHGLTELML